MNTSAIRVSGTRTEELETAFQTHGCFSAPDCDDFIGEFIQTRTSYRTRYTRLFCCLFRPFSKLCRANDYSKPATCSTSQPIPTAPQNDHFSHNPFGEIISFLNPDQRHQEAHHCRIWLPCQLTIAARAAIWSTRSDTNLSSHHLDCFISHPTHIHITSCIFCSRGFRVSLDCRSFRLATFQWLASFEKQTHCEPSS